MRITDKNLLMEQNQKNVLTGLVIVLVIAGFVGFFVWGMTHLTLGKKIGQLYQEKMTFQEMLKNKDKEKEEALEKTIAQFKSVIQAKDQEGSKRVESCVEGSLEKVRSQADIEMFNNALAHKDIKNYQESIEYVKWCDFSDLSLSLFEPAAFIFVGNFGGPERHIVGFVSREDNDFSVILSKISNSTFEIAACGITGFVDGNLIYQCYGDPNPGRGAHSEAYILHKDSGKSVLIKSCDYIYDEAGKRTNITCDKNSLNLPK